MGRSTVVNLMVQTREKFNKTASNTLCEFYVTSSIKIHQQVVSELCKVQGDETKTTMLYIWVNSISI